MFYRKILFASLLTCINIYSQYSSVNDIFILEEKLAVNHKTIDSITSKLKNINKKTLFLNSISSFFFKKKQYDLALKYAKKELEFYPNNELNDSDYHNALYITAFYSKKNGDLNNALILFKKASRLNFFPKKKAQALCEIGYLYRLYGENKKSLDYYIKGVELLKKHGTLGNVITNSVNLSLSSYNLNDNKDIETGVYYLENAKTLLKQNPQLYTNRRQNAIYTCLANLYAKLNNSSKASFFYKKIISLAIKKNNYYQLALNYMNYGELLLLSNKKEYIHYINKSLEITKNYDIKNKKLINAENYRILSKSSLNSNNLLQAYHYINKSIQLSLNLTNENLTPNKSQLIKTIDRLNLLTALSTKIKILKQLYLKKKNSKFLNQIIETVNISDQLVEIILEDSTESSTQFSWRNDVSQIYNYGVYAARVLGDKDLQFQYLEKNKAFLLTQSINDNNYSLNLPNHIVERELQYKKQILELENKASKNKQLKDSLFDIKFNYQNFKDSIQLAYPKHFESKQKVQLTSLDKVQKTINDNTIIISYALQDEEIIDNISSGLLISKNKTIPFAISNIDTLQKNLNLYRQLIAKPLNTKEEIIQFNKVSYYLYQNLFPTKEIQELIKGKQLTIIPDNQLQNIPFEAFITDTSSNSYLIEDNDISYAYSMSFSNINNNIERTQTKEFAGFAPINFENQKLTSLEYSEKEINTISDNLNGLSLTGNSVTKDSFFKNAANAKIIHLATHADVSKKPVVHFSKDSLNLHELYTYKNNADLVVLSACETNLGELKKGEGILNLARGFFYSGSKSVVSSLWKVNDVATTSLMTDFYSNLKDHQSKSEALNNAKRNYLKTHTLSEKSPYYWASFILIGDTAPTFKSDYTLYYIIGFFVLSLLFLFFFKKRG
ncbi:CHAT domain-containing protein [uncultured Tenacibaculum sp.]|uniref:CHAT domain-containing protein n=1 Tax=uncultured Tenacibaculum sp. TaxID=174713 RepID=UPI002629DDB6|nr:CHAT domain-containing protein [uncultured Tenacibaculum sp.]